MLDAISYSSQIKIEDIPPQWLSKIELYSSELLNFPLIYIHKIVDGRRVYGFPVAIIREEFNQNSLLDITFEFLSNIDINADENLKSLIKQELEERIGAKDKISKDDVLVMCRSDIEYQNFFSALWVSIEQVYGKYIPYGKFFEEMYSIVRFVAAFQPKTGKQSELRMLYNFMSIFGEKIEVNIDGKWNFCDFFLIPCYENVLAENFEDFPKFEKLYQAMKKVYNLSFTNSLNINDNGTQISIKCQTETFPQNRDKFVLNVLTPWFERGVLTETDKFYIERLTDAFNRFPWRAAFFISSIFISFEKSYSSWSKNFFIDFYDKANKGISPKVIACFLQQGFKNPNVIPIDIWVESFYKYALNIEDNEHFFSKFDNIGKLERVIWLSSQANKTNIRQFFNMLWCNRYGVNGNKKLRGQNPLSCYECSLRPVCKGYKNIKNQKVFVEEINSTNTTYSSDIEFICQVSDSIPKKIFKKTNKELIDEFSGYLLKNNRTSIFNDVVTVEELLDSITPAYDTNSFDSLENNNV